MIKKIGRQILNKLQFLIPESVLVRHSKGIFDKKDTSLVTSIMRNSFNERYKNASPEKKKELGLLVWRSEAATHYFKDRTLPETVVSRFHTVIEKNSDFNVCEIGTGNGYLVDILSKRSANSHFEGVDLSDEQIKLNQKTYEKNSKLQFVCSDILEYVQKNGNVPTIYISYVSLTTFTPEMVTELFEYIAKRASPSILALYEPIQSNTAGSQNSMMRGGLAYAHNYVTIARQNGFTVAEELSDPPFLWLVCKKISNINN